MEHDMYTPGSLVLGLFQFQYYLPDSFLCSRCHVLRVERAATG